jgi:hypothetical protein
VSLVYQLLIITGPQRLGEEAKDDGDCSGNHPNGRRSQLWRWTGSGGELGRILWTLRLPGPFVAGFGLVACGRGGDSCRRRVPGSTHTDAAAVARNRSADPGAVGADVGVWSRRDRFGATLLFQRSAIPLGRCRAAPGVSGSGLADRLALGAQTPAPRMVGAGGCGPVSHRPGLCP